MRKLFLLVASISIILLTLFPRSVEVIAHNYLFGFDQGREYLAAKGIVIDHKFILIGTELGAGDAGISGIFHGPIYYYLLTIPFILFHGDPYGGTVMMFLFGLATVIFSFFLGKKLFAIWGGLLVAFLVAVSPPLISQSRFIWSPNPPSFFILLTFYFVYQFLKEKRFFFLFLAAFFSAFVYNFEFAIAIPMCLTLFTFSLFQGRKNIKSVVILLAGYFVGFLPMILFESRHKFMALHGVISYLFSHNTTHTAHKENFFFFIAQHWGTFLSNLADTFPKRGLLPEWMLAGFLVLGVVYFLRKETNTYLKHFFAYLLLLFPINFIVFSFLRNTVYPYYLTDLTFAYILLFSYIMWSAFQQRNIWVQSLTGLYIGALLITAVLNTVSTSIYDYSDFGGIAKIKGLEQVMDYIYTDAHGKPFGLLIFAPPIYTYQYDYMAWWYSERKYHYKPYSEKKGTVYLLIEPDPYKPWSYKGWLETVIKTGDVVSTTTLPSGFIVQKRIME